jgi:hypothetical protein
MEQPSDASSLILNPAIRFKIFLTFTAKSYLLVIALPVIFF